ncbi:membrane protein [Devosia geojensis]|uniref:Inner membrane protein YccF n=1 Tax=Devosia geojensis TaxID=443610 RepID=A0A0F5FU38_9HYPH|nr:YccF family protein [Devosia geojensis]KKB12389.1 membrane protein [Devosia geojensis]
MRFAGNVIWFVLGGAVTGLIWLIGAAVFAVTIIGLPLTRAAVEMAKMSAFPFGKEVVHIRELDARELDATTAVTGAVGFIFNVLWALTFGLLLFVAYLISGILCCLTIIGIPFGLQAFKLAGLSLWPVGRRVVPIELAQAAREANAQDRLAAYRRRPA